MLVNQASQTFYKIDEANQALKDNPGQIAALSIRECIGAGYSGNGYSVSESTRKERDAGLRQLGALMETLSSPFLSRSVKTLDLSYIKLGTLGALQVAGMLMRNTTLEKLVVHGNRLGSARGIGHDWDRPEGFASGCRILIDAQKSRATPLNIDFGYPSNDCNWLSEGEKELVDQSRKEEELAVTVHDDSTTLPDDLDKMSLNDID
ncbi:MAG: hypothetical protein ACHQUC_08350 [Chlamydiales bacterium]